MIGSESDFFFESDPDFFFGDRFRDVFRGSDPGLFFGGGLWSEGASTHLDSLYICYVGSGPEPDTVTLTDFFHLIIYSAVCPKSPVHICIMGRYI